MLYYYNARYNEPLIGRFISPDTIVPNLSNPQSFNRYSYCLNNPLKYIDPSGNNNVTVETNTIDPWIRWWIAGCGWYIGDTAYTMINDDGTTATVYNGGGAPIVVYDGREPKYSIQGTINDIPNAVYDVANRMRIASGDNDLWIGRITEGIYFVDHYHYKEGIFGNSSYEQYYFNESRKRMELVYEYGEGKVNPLSAEAIARGIIGGLIMGAGIFVAYTGVVLYCDAWVPGMGDSLFWGPVLAWGGYEKYNFNNGAEELVRAIRHEWFHEYEKKTQWNWAVNYVATYCALQELYTNNPYDIHPAEVRARIYAGQDPYPGGEPKLRERIIIPQRFFWW
jgi:hypothetical protein